MPRSVTVTVTDTDLGADTHLGTDELDRLRDVGLRVTRPRVAVLEVLAAEPHLAADQVLDRVRGRLGSVSVQAVYDTLNTLTSAAVLRRFEPAGSAMRYELGVGDNHHHLVCRSCGRVEDVPCDVGAMPCAQPAETGGFSVEEAEVTYWGRCSECLDPPSDRPGVPAGSLPAHPHPERNA